MLLPRRRRTRGCQRDTLLPVSSSKAGPLDGFSSPLLFTAETARNAPAEAGVHVVLADDIPVYVGSTANLRRRLREHLQGDRQASVLHDQVGQELDTEAVTASVADIANWLGRCTVIWTPTDDPRQLKAQLVADLRPRFNRSVEQPGTGLWWVNQGLSYEQELDAGIVFAGSGGPQVAHHLNVARMQPGDVVLHYRRGLLVALGEAFAPPVQANRPYGDPFERDDGWLTRVEYFPLDQPIPLADLPERSALGPFNVAGGVKQGYLFALDRTFGDETRDSFRDRWPAGSPWAGDDRRFWLFQANPKQWDLLAHLPEMPPGHLEDWTVTRHRQDMQPGDGVVLWQGGASAAILALGRLHGVPELREKPAFRPDTPGEQEYRVELRIERHVQPAITKLQVQADPKLASLEVLHRPWGGTNLQVTTEQWRAIRRLLPLDPDAPALHWDPFVHWSIRFAESLNLDEVERTYKLTIATKVAAAAEALQSGAADWPQLLRRAFGSPNNLTSFHLHGRFLDWVDQHRDEAERLLAALWADEGSLHDRVDAFCELLPSTISGGGTRANLSSFLLAAQDVTALPVFRVKAFNSAYQLTGWPHQADADPADRYDEALAFLDAYLKQYQNRGLQLRDRLDAQGLLWQVVSGNAPPGWSDADIAAYARFLKGHTVDELAELVGQFRAEVGYPADGRPERDEQRDELAAALTAEALAEPDVRLLRRLAGPAYGSPGPQPGFNTLLQTDEGVARIAATLRHLLYGQGDMVDRLEECLSGAHKLPKVGEAMMVKALAVVDPGRWFPNYVTGGKVGKLAVLDLLSVERPAAESAASRAATSNDAIRAMLEPHLLGDPWGMQEFGWWLLYREHVPESPLAALTDELYLSEEFLERILRLLDDKGQVVFYGPPGTGKTFAARKLAGHIARGGGTVEKIQFHASYSYEDLIEGYRPRLVNGQVTYEVVDGPLKRLAATAQERPDVTHVLLIDELNRGNVSKILGELLFLLEYRDEEIRLLYSEAPFSLPPNLQIIATMNTADRSIALVDTALRRRFHFVPFFPDTPPIDTLLRRWLTDKQPDKLWIADVVARANELLADRNVAIGPSHFLKPDLTDDLIDLAWEASVLPFLEEHFFSDPEQLRRFALDRLRTPSTTTHPGDVPTEQLEEPTVP